MEFNILTKVNAIFIFFYVWIFYLNLNVFTKRIKEFEDIFYLGNSEGLYYDDRDPDTNGRRGFALIKDFDFSAGDRIRIGGPFTTNDFITSRLRYQGVPGTAYILTKG